MTSNRKRSWYRRLRERAFQPMTKGVKPSITSFRSLQVDALEDRRMLAFDVVTIGDSWASFIADGAPGNGDLVSQGNAFQNVLNFAAPGTTVYNGGFYGGTSGTHSTPTELASITNNINASGADIVYLSTGGNDILLSPGWNLSLSPGDEQARANGINANVNTIVNHILNIRPDIQIVIAGYDYPNLWDPELSGSIGSAGNLIRDLYGLGLQGTPGGILDGAPVAPAVDIGGNAEFNAFFRLVEQGKEDIANASRRVHHVDNFGLMNSVNGYNGYFGNYPAGLSPNSYADLPYSPSRLGPGNDPIHLDTTGYEQLVANAYINFLGEAFANNANLQLTTTTLGFGTLRIGTTANLSTTASNSGSNFSKVENLSFGAASGDFGGGAQGFNPLFKDPQLGSDTAIKNYSYTPTGHGADAQNIGVSSSHGGATLSLTGNGVGPAFSSVSTLDLGSVISGGTASEVLDVGNLTGDGDLGSLTDLSLLTATISGADAAAFSISSFVPGTVLEAGATQGYTIEFDSTGLPPGAKTAILTFSTDEGSSFGTVGTQFQIILTAGLAAGVTANIGGPYSGDEGTLIGLSAAGSAGGVLYEWDLDNDGQYDDAVGENVNFNAVDSGVFPISVRVNGASGPTDSTTVTVNNLAPTAAITGTTDIYRGEEVIFTLTATDASPVDQGGLFDFEIDWDGNGTFDETIVGVPSGTTVQHSFPAATPSNTLRIRSTDKDGATSDISELSVSISPHVLRDDGFGNTDLIWGGTNLLDSVYVLGGGSSVSLFVQFEGLQFVNRLDFFGPAVTGKIILHGYGFSDVLIGEFSTHHVVEIHGGDGDDVIVGGFLGDELFGDGGNDVILGGTQFTDGDDMLFGGQGKDTIFGHLGADTLDGGGGEDLLISDRYGFSNIAQDVQRIGNEWKSGRPYAERVTNILGITSTGVNGTSILGANVTVAEDNAQDVLIGGLGAMDWFFYDFDEDLLGDVIELDEEETDSNP